MLESEFDPAWCRCSPVVTPPQLLIWMKKCMNSFYALKGERLGERGPQRESADVSWVLHWSKGVLPGLLQHHTYYSVLWPQYGGPESWNHQKYITTGNYDNSFIKRNIKSCRVRTHEVNVNINQQKLLHEFASTEGEPEDGAFPSGSTVLWDIYRFHQAG